MRRSQPLIISKDGSGSFLTNSNSSSSTTIHNDISLLTTTSSPVPTSQTFNSADALIYNHHYNVVNNNPNSQLINTSHNMNSVVVDKSTNLFQSDNGN